MHDVECVAFLQWALPRLRFAWRGFRRVRRQVCRRIDRRLGELGLADTDAYRDFLETHAEEWAVLDTLCRIPISRFYRDPPVFDCLRASILPKLAQRAAEGPGARLDCWSAGCGGGEEPYTLALCWELDVGPRFPGVDLRVVATDADPAQLARARAGVYTPSSLRTLPESWRRRAFRARGEEAVLEARFRSRVELERQDLRLTTPPQPFDLILCRNLAFTYFDAALQAAVRERLCARLGPGGVLVIGRRERLPDGGERLEDERPELGVYRRADCAKRAPG